MVLPSLFSHSESRERRVTVIAIRSLRGFYTRGDPLPPSIPHKYDVILAADCVYFEPAFPLLVKTLVDLVVDESAEVLFCYKKRRKVRWIEHPGDLFDRTFDVR